MNGFASVDSSEVTELVRVARAVHADAGVAVSSDEDDEPSAAEAAAVRVAGSHQRRPRSLGDSSGLGAAFAGGHQAPPPGEREVLDLCDSD